MLLKRPKFDPPGLVLSSEIPPIHNIDVGLPEKFMHHCISQWLYLAISDYIWLCALLAKPLHRREILALRKEESAISDKSGQVFSTLQNCERFQLIRFHKASHRTHITSWRALITRGRKMKEGVSTKLNVLVGKSFPFAVPWKLVCLIYWPVFLSRASSAGVGRTSLPAFGAQILEIQF